MWSGPRNISTALMRSFDNRDDSVVVDEPFYAFYLNETGAGHPGTAEILESQPTSWSTVAESLLRPLAAGERVFYQKQMAHHLLPSIGRDWMRGLSHAFLIREPRAMLASYVNKRGEAKLEDLGFPQQVALYRWLEEETGKAAPVIDSRQVLEDPKGVLNVLCQALGIEFQESMLTWEPGPRATDGVWADHWYDAVLASTGFQEYRPKIIELTPELERVAEEAQADYEFLLDRCLRT